MIWQIQTSTQICFIAAAYSYMECRLNSDTIKCLTLTSLDLLTCQRRRNLEVTIDNKIQFHSQVRGNLFSSDREVVVTNFRCNDELVNDQMQASNWIGGNKIHAWWRHDDMTAKFTLGPVLTTITFRPGDVSLDRLCVQYELFSLSKKIKYYCCLHQAVFEYVLIPSFRQSDNKSNSTFYKIETDFQTEL
jgi:hypothetical protein